MIETNLNQLIPVAKQACERIYCNEVLVKIPISLVQKFN